MHYCDKSTLLMLTAGSEAAGEACSVDRLVYPGPGRGRRRRTCFVSDCPVSESSTSKPFQSATIWERKKYEHRFVSDNNECEAGSAVGKEGVGRRLVFEGSTDWDLGLWLGYSVYGRVGGRSAVSVQDQIRSVMRVGGDLEKTMVARKMRPCRRGW